MVEAASDRRVSRVGRFLSRVWALALATGLGWLAYTFREFNTESYLRIDPLVVLQNVPAVFLAFVLAQWLMRKRVFRWRPSDLFVRRPADAAPVSANGSLLVVAMRIPVIGLAVMGLLVYNLPTIAALEELIFREGTTDAKSVIVRSALFGLAHFGTDLPLGSAVSIAVVGLWFSHWYLLGGVALSAQAHFSYLLIIFALVLPAMLYGRVKALFSTPRP